MAVNIILNGTFDAGTANWSGVDIEVNPERAFLPGGSTNPVSEIDGRKNQTTILEQTFTIDAPIVTDLTFDVALRTSALNDAPDDGFNVEIVDDAGNVVASLPVRPLANSFVPITLQVDFATAGDYTLRFTEVGDDDSRGAIVDNIEILVCFASGTKIMTPTGAVAIDDLQIGDLVTTQQGPQKLRWIGKRQVLADTLSNEPRFAPVRITAGALGCGLPQTDLLVSRQHRMLAQSPVAERMFGARDILVSAIRMTALPGIYVDDDIKQITYFHLLFDRHEVVFANGAPSESMLRGAMALDALSSAARAEITAMFPNVPAVPDPVCVVPSGRRQRQFMHRLAKNNHTVLQAK